MSWATATSASGATSKPRVTLPYARAGIRSFAWVHFNRGLSLARAGRLLDARDAYDRAIDIENDWREARVNRALVELELNQLESARDDLIHAIKLGQSDVIVLAALGEAWARLGRPQESERYFVSLLDKDRQ